jgi:DNA polymerase III epsilon subunit-like protein
VLPKRRFASGEGGEWLSWWLLSVLVKKMVTLNRQNCAQEPVRSFIILDLETTGLPYDKPVRITEIAMVAALREHILGCRTDAACEVVLPRVLSKLTVCVHPKRTVSNRAAEITRMLYCFCHLH